MTSAAWDDGASKSAGRLWAKYSSAPPARAAVVKGSRSDRGCLRVTISGTLSHVVGNRLRIGLAGWTGAHSRRSEVRRTDCRAVVREIAEPGGRSRSSFLRAGVGVDNHRVEPVGIASCVATRGQPPTEAITAWRAP